jgi:spermidine/putrescine transport system permease protein
VDRGRPARSAFRLWAMMRLGFRPDFNALVALVLGLTAAMCILAVRRLLTKEMNDENGD